MPAQSRYPRPWAWPGNANIAMSIGLAFEAFQYHSQYWKLLHYEERTRRLSSRSRVSFGELPLRACLYEECAPALPRLAA